MALDSVPKVLTGKGAGALIARGLFHCHSHFSFDGSLSMAQLAALLRERSLQFAILTDHDAGFDRGLYGQQVAECNAVGDESLVIVPGLELLTDEGVEIAAVGAQEFVTERRLALLSDDLRRKGCFSAVVHPLKKSVWQESFREFDAIEVLNGKIDGTLAPNLALLAKVRQGNNRLRPTHAIFGLDLHDASCPVDAWIECDVPRLTSYDIVSALIAGRYVNRVRWATVDSRGGSPFGEAIRIRLLRAAFVTWDNLMLALPPRYRRLCWRLSRNVIASIKGRA